MFKEMLKGLIWVIDAILTSAVNSNLLSDTLQAFNPTIYTHVMNIINGAVKTVAFTLLSLFCLLEFLKMTTKTEGMNQGTMSVEMIARVMFKIFLCKVIIDNVALVMNAIYDISLFLINGIRTLIGGGGGASVLDLPAINAMIDSMGLGDQIGSLIIALVVLLVVSIVVMIVDVIVIARFLEIFIMLAISPIPISTLCHEEFNSVAKGFLKSFTAVCLQGVLIFIVISFFPLLLNASFLDGADNGTVWIKLLGVLGYSFILALAVFSTQKWAKSVCNAM